MEGALGGVALVRDGADHSARMRQGADFSKEISRAIKVLESPIPGVLAALGSGSYIATGAIEQTRWQRDLGSISTSRV
jgi:hypothetical protein